jgi:tetratricopeptide (TPR) repeat protein
MNLGRLDEAEREVALEPEEFSRNYILAHIEISRGQRDAAIKRVRALQAYGETQPNQADAFAYPAYIYARLGEFDQAFAMLERMRLARDSSIPWLRNSLDLKPLQLDPRWPALLQKIGLADDQLK